MNPDQLKIEPHVEVMTFTKTSWDEVVFNRLTTPGYYLGLEHLFNPIEWVRDPHSPVNHIPVGVKYGLAINHLTGQKAMDRAETTGDINHLAQTVKTPPIPEDPRDSHHISRAKAHLKDGMEILEIYFPPFAHDYLIRSHHGPFQNGFYDPHHRMRFLEQIDKLGLDTRSLFVLNYNQTVFYGPYHPHDILNEVKNLTKKS